MTFNSYLTYSEYTQYGGTVSETAFPNLERKAQRYLDYFTFDRIKIVLEITGIMPEVIKEVLTEFINVLATTEIVDKPVDSYSNGVETLTYNNSSANSILAQLNNLCKDWLPNYLTVRSVNFDVIKYLQSNDYNS